MGNILKTSLGTWSPPKVAAAVGLTALVAVAIPLATVFSSPRKVVDERYNRDYENNAYISKNASWDGDPEKGEFDATINIYTSVGEASSATTDDTEIVMLMDVSGSMAECSQNHVSLKTNEATDRFGSSVAYDASWEITLNRNGLTGSNKTFTGSEVYRVYTNDGGYYGGANGYWYITPKKSGSRPLTPDSFLIVKSYDYGKETAPASYGHFVGSLNGPLTKRIGAAEPSNKNLVMYSTPKGEKWDTNTGSLKGAQTDYLRSHYSQYECGQLPFIKAESAAHSFIDSIIKNTEKASISIVPFAGIEEAEGSFSRDTEDLKAQITGAYSELGFGTDYYKALSKAELILKDSSAQFKYVLFMTDGENSPVKDEAEGNSSLAVSMANRIKQKGAILYSVGFGTSNSTLSSIASPGCYKTGTQINGIFQEIADRILNGGDIDYSKYILSDSMSQYFDLISVVGGSKSGTTASNTFDIDGSMKSMELHIRLKKEYQKPTEVTWYPTNSVCKITYGGKTLEVESPELIVPGIPEYDWRADSLDMITRSQYITSGATAPPAEEADFYETNATGAHVMFYFSLPVGSWSDIKNPTADFLIDNTVVEESYVYGAEEDGSYQLQFYVDFSQLSNGSHTLSARINWEERTKETNANNNVISKTIRIDKNKYDFEIFWLELCDAKGEPLEGKNVPQTLVKVLPHAQFAYYGLAERSYPYITLLLDGKQIFNTNKTQYSGDMLSATGAWFTCNSYITDSTDYNGYYYLNLAELSLGKHTLTYRINYSQRGSETISTNNEMTIEFNVTPSPYDYNLMKSNIVSTHEPGYSGWIIGPLLDGDYGDFLYNYWLEYTCETHVNRTAPPVKVYLDGELVCSGTEYLGYSNELISGGSTRSLDLIKLNTTKLSKGRHQLELYINWDERDMETNPDNNYSSYEFWISDGNAFDFAAIEVHASGGKEPEGEAMGGGVVIPQGYGKINIHGIAACLEGQNLTVPYVQFYLDNKLLYESRDYAIAPVGKGYTWDINSRVPAGDSLVLNTEDLTLGMHVVKMQINKKRHQQGSDDGSAAESNKDNNVAYLLLNVVEGDAPAGPSWDLAIEMVEPNGAYKAGEEIVTSFKVYNKSGPDITNSNAATVTFQVFADDGTGEECIITMTDKVVIPQGGENLISFKWLNPVDTAGKALRCKGTISPLGMEGAE